MSFLIAQCTYQGSISRFRKPTTVFFPWLEHKRGNVVVSFLFFSAQNPERKKERGRWNTGRPCWKGREEGERKASGLEGEWRERESWGRREKEGEERQGERGGGGRLFVSLPLACLLCCLPAREEGRGKGAGLPSPHPPIQNKQATPFPPLSPPPTTWMEKLGWPDT